MFTNKWIIFKRSISFNLSIPFGSILVTVWLDDIKIFIIDNSYSDKNSSLFSYSKLEFFANKGKSVLMPLIKIKKLDGKYETLIPDDERGCKGIPNSSSNNNYNEYDEYNNYVGFQKEKKEIVL